MKGKDYNNKIQLKWMKATKILLYIILVIALFGMLILFML